MSITRLAIHRSVWSHHFRISNVHRSVKHYKRVKSLCLDLAAEILFNMALQPTFRGARRPFFDVEEMFFGPPIKVPGLSGWEVRRSESPSGDVEEMFFGPPIIVPGLSGWEVRRSEISTKEALSP